MYTVACLVWYKHICDGIILLKIHISHGGKYFNTLLCTMSAKPNLKGGAKY